jgi:hypothetical protein
MSNKPELELKHILPYLPYKLKCNEKWTLISLSSLEDHAMFDYSARFDGENKKGYIQFLKPMLRPMSDLFENIVHNEEIICVAKVIKNLDDSIEWWNGCRTALHYPETGEFCITSSDELIYQTLNYNIVATLFKYHFDVFGLIEKGLAEPIKNK